MESVAGVLHSASGRGVCLWSYNLRYCSGGGGLGPGGDVHFGLWHSAKLPLCCLQLKLRLFPSPWCNYVL